MAKSLEFYIWVANDTLIGCNVQMALPTASPASLLRRGVLASGPSLCVLAHRVILQRRRKGTRMRATEWRARPPLPRHAFAPRAAENVAIIPQQNATRTKCWGWGWEETRLPGRRAEAGLGAASPTLPTWAPCKWFCWFFSLGHLGLTVGAA